MPNLRQGEFVEGNYTFLHSGRPPGQTKLKGVAIAVKKKINTIRSLVINWKGFSSRVMSMRIKLDKFTATVVSVLYAPTFKRPPEEKALFYDQLSEVLTAIPRLDRVFLLGDFNARVGRNQEAWPDVIGAHGPGDINEQGTLLLELCTCFGLCITNTCFSHADIHKGTWQHPRSKRWHLIDYIIVRQHYKSDVLDSGVRRSADCWTDHKMVCARVKLRFHLSTQKRKATTPKRLNVRKLSDPSISDQLQESICENLSGITSENFSLEQRWEYLRDTIYNSAKDTIGFQKRNHRDWFDEYNPTIRNLLNQEQTAFQAVLSNDTRVNRARYSQSRSTCQRELRRLLFFPDGCSISRDSRQSPYHLRVSMIFCMQMMLLWPLKLVNPYKKASQP